MVETTHTNSRTARIGRGMAALLCLAAGQVGAGGHLDIDDAGMLDPGQCQYEAWFGRVGPTPVTRVWHVGPACRVGPVEMGINLDRLGPGDHAVVLGPQVKWRYWGDADSTWSAAVSATVSFEMRRSQGRPGGQLLLPLTWHPDPKLWVHVNYGADWALGDGARTPRGGIGVEWALHDKLSLLAERFKSGGLWATRAGLRYSVTPLVSIDLTASRWADGSQRVRGFVLGLNHEFSRP